MSLFRIKYEWTEWKIKKNCTKPKAGMYAIATSFQIHRNQTHIQKPQNPLQSVLVTANVCLQSNARNNNNEPNNNNSVNKKSSLTHNFRGDWHDLTIYCAMPTCSGRHAVIFYISFFLFINVFIRAFWFASFFSVHSGLSLVIFSAFFFFLFLSICFASSHRFHVHTHTTSWNTHADGTNGSIGFWFVRSRSCSIQHIVYIYVWVDIDASMPVDVLSTLGGFMSINAIFFLFISGLIQSFSMHTPYFWCLFVWLVGCCCCCVVLLESMSLLLFRKQFDSTRKRQRWR